MPNLGGDVLTSSPTSPPVPPPLPSPSPPTQSSVFLQNCVGPLANGGDTSLETLDGGRSNGLLLPLQFPLHDQEASEVKKVHKPAVDVLLVKKERERKGKSKSMEEHVSDWVERRLASGVPEKECVLPFLCNAPKMVECVICRKTIYNGDAVLCTVRDCQAFFHKRCAKQETVFSNDASFKCPQHICLICKQRAIWRCVRCTVAAHTKCSPWPNDVIQLDGRPNRAICWRHPKDWHHEYEHTLPTQDFAEVFHRLPLPYTFEEFSVDALLKDVLQNKSEPTPYMHIRRNVYLIKKKRDFVNAGGGCTSCNSNSTCNDNCECRGQSVSCSKSCHCSDLCSNRPFRKDKRIKVVKTQFCGWGVEALEDINNGDFVIEYIGEVIDDAQCEKRLWEMKYRGDQNFYMCEIGKNFIIDATFKGNVSRFLNHSCDPNCKLEKWHVEGEIRVGVFASRSIAAGEPLTYDYRFEHFGPMAKCNCGASNCQGYLGSKRKMYKEAFFAWGCKRKRSTETTITLGK